MRIIVTLLIALFAVSGIVSAIDIQITSPTDGAVYELGKEKVQIRSTVVDNGGNSDFRARTFINGALNKCSNWAPPDVGIYEIECRLIMLDEDFNPTGETISDFVTIEVVSGA